LARPSGRVSYDRAVFSLDSTELIGYLASLLVVVSLAMTSVVKLRAISMLGSLAFLIYGALLGSVPLLITNGAIIVLNVWFLRKELAPTIDLGVSRIRPDSPFLIDFLRYHMEDIHRFQPDFSMPEEESFTLVLTRDGLPAGAVVGRRQGPVLELTLDYVLKAYRDSRLGDWLFGPGAAVFRAEGFTRIESDPGTELHAGYLERIGFRRVGDRYVLEL
jgi:hypothetical protein